MRKIPPEIVKAVHREHVPGVVGKKALARRYGISATSVRRILEPEFAERMRIETREAKRRRTGTCERCGAETRYGGGKQAVSRLCVPCSRIVNTRWTREVIVQRIRDWAELHGRPPSAKNWLHFPPNGTRRREWPTVQSVQRAFGSWAAGIEAAGFTRPEAGGRYQDRPHTRRYDRDEIKRLLSSGMPKPEIARQIGCSRHLVYLIANHGTTGKVRP